MLLVLRQRRVQRWVAWFVPADARDVQGGKLGTYCIASIVDSETAMNAGLCLR